MKEHLTPQEAALYLGQEIQYDRPGMGANGHSNYTFTALLSGNLWQQIAEGRAANCKLHLRPLTDITEEEAIEAKLYSPKREWHQMYFHEWIEELKRQMGYRELEFKPSQITYLLFKGFDLFNWIEQGKALDKTTLSKLTPKSKN